MPQAPAYNRSTPFADDERDNAGGRSTVRTARIDSELDAVAASVNALRANQELNQRDDGEIRDQRVKLHTLASDVLALMLVANGATPRGAWLTATDYKLRDLVNSGGNTYLCAIEHTSGTFATDLAAGRWLLISLAVNPAASGIPFTPTATVSAINAQLAIEEVDAEYRAADALLDAAITMGLSDLIADIAAGSGAAMVGYQLSDSGAKQTDLGKQQERQVLDVFRFMDEAVIADVCSATPVMDHSDDLQAAINAVQVLAKGERRLRINSTLAGYFRVTKPLVISSNFLTIEFDSTNAIIKKFFDGEVFHINGGEVEIHRCAIDGNGATYLGGGIRLLGGAANSFRLINPRIKETAAAPVLIESDAGSLMKIKGGLLQPYNAAAAGPTHAVAMLGDDTAPKNRLLLGVSTGGAPIVDASGAETMLIGFCDGSGITTSATSKKILAVGNRMQTAGANVTVRGLDHCIQGNIVASRFELAAGTTNCVVKDNTQVGGDTIDSSGNTTNKVEFFGSSYTPNWTAASVNPVLGNGTLVGAFDRRDKEVFATLDLTVGSTTTTGSGAYSFTIPLQAVAGRDFTGSVWLLDSGAVFYVGTVLVIGGALSAQVYFNGAAGAMGPTVPITLATGDRLRVQIRYIAA